MIKKCLFIALMLFSCALYAKEAEQDFSQTKIGWDGDPEYEFKLIECKGSTYTSVVYLKFAIKHNLANQYVTITGDNAYDKRGKKYYVNIWGNKSVGGYSYYSSVDRVLKTDNETTIDLKIEVNGKIDKFDTVKMEFYINKPYYSKANYKLEFINLPIEWKFLNF